MPTFDAEGARAAGYPDAVIRGVQGALAAGYTPDEISAHLSQQPPLGYVLDKPSAGKLGTVQGPWLDYQKDPVAAGPWDDYKADPVTGVPAGYQLDQPNTLTDVAKSGGAGILKGLTGGLGLPGTVAHAVLSNAPEPNVAPPGIYGSVVSALEKARGALELPTGAGIQKTVESVTGPLHEPQTTAGKYAGTVGEFAGNPFSYIGPGGVAAKLGTAVRGAIGSEAAGQAAEGTGLEGVARFGGGVLGGVSSGLARRMVSPTPTLAPKLTRNVAGVDVPLSPGQESGNVTQQIMENAALRGARGDRAQQVAEGFFSGQQAPANEAARAAVGRGLDPFGMAVADNPQEAAELVGSSVRNIAGTQKQSYKNLYDEAMGLPGEFHASAFEGIGQRIKGDLSLGKSPVIIDDVTTPVANKAIQDIDQNISRLKIQNRADPFGQPNPQNITGVNLAGVDQTRKRLTAMAGATDPGSADRRAMSRIIGAFDDHIESAISDGLFTGDDRALDAIREARGAYSAYRKTFSSQGAGDDVGRVMEKIIGRNGGDGATPTEIANYLYVNAKVGGSGTSVRLAQRLQDVLGPQSPEWSAVRQGLWSRLTEATEGTAAFGPQRIASRVGEFLNGSGKPLAQMMFTPSERAQIERYADLQRQLTPKPGTVNYSNTGVLMSALKASANSILTFLGAHLGGPIGAVAGAAVGPIGSRIKENMAAGALSRSLYQPGAARSPYRPNVGRALINAGVSGVLR